MKKILILASNPRKDLNLEQEIRDLKGVIRRSSNKTQFEVEIELAVRPGDLQGRFLEHEPRIVHFCGHGTGEQGLVLENDAGREQLVTTEALSSLFELFNDKVECVLLNACYSEVQANAIIEHINYVIGMRQEIRDDAAIAFATGFYQGLGYGKSIEQSYKLGCNAIQLKIDNNATVSEEQRKLGVADVVAARKVIPEHLKPILNKKANLTIIPDSDVSRPDNSIAPATQVEIQLHIDRAVGKEIALKQYREKVKEFLSDRVLTDFENIHLDILKEDLKLSDEEAEKILEEEQAPIKQPQQFYTKMLSSLIKQGFYPFNEGIRNELKKIKAEKNLTEEEVEQISKPIIEKAEVEYQVKLRQRCEQEFKQVIKDIEKALQQKEWELADQKTTEELLKEAGRSDLVGSEREQIKLNEKEIKRISCPVLQELNQLWENNSQGRFGFAKQYNIWKSVNPDNVVKSNWNEFAARVGWKEDGSEENNWTSLSFTTAANEGHLPSFIYVPNGQIDWGQFFNRIQYCNL